MIVRRLAAVFAGAFAALLIAAPALQAAVLKASTSGTLARSSQIDGVSIGGSDFRLHGVFDTAASLSPGRFALERVVVTVDGFGDIRLAPETSFNTFVIGFSTRPEGVRASFGKSIGGWFVTYAVTPAGFDPDAPSPGTLSGPVSGAFAENSARFPTLGQGPFSFGVVEDGLGPVVLSPAPIPLPAAAPLLLAGLAGLAALGRRARRA